MAGFGYDTSVLTITVDLPDGSKVEVVGDNDGVNGVVWSATLHSKPEGDPATVTMTNLPIAVDALVLIDGIEEAETT